MAQAGLELAHRRAAGQKIRLSANNPPPAPKARAEKASAPPDAIAPELASDAQVGTGRHARRSVAAESTDCAAVAIAKLCPARFETDE